VKCNTSPTALDLFQKIKDFVSCGFRKDNKLGLTVFRNSNAS